MRDLQFMAGTHDLFRTFGGPYGPGLLLLSFAAATIAVILLVRAWSARGERLRPADPGPRASHEQMVEALESISDGFILFGPDLRVVACNHVFRDMYPELRDLLVPGTRYPDIVREWTRRRDAAPPGAGGPDRARLLRDPLEPTAFLTAEEIVLSDGRCLYVKGGRTKSGGVVGLWTDITRIKEMRDILQRMAHSDSLTNLPNRNLFYDRLGQAAARSRRSGDPFSLLYVDLDGFKPVNDTLGHEAGDLALKEVARRLKACVRGIDTVARIGGDEFALILEPNIGPEGARMVADRILASFAREIGILGREWRLGASIGVAVYPADASDPESLIRLADAAMYKAKQAGKNAYRFHGEPSLP